MQAMHQELIQCQLVDAVVHGIHGTSHPTFPRSTNTKTLSTDMCLGDKRANGCRNAGIVNTQSRVWDYFTQNWRFDAPNTWEIDRKIQIADTTLNVRSEEPPENCSYSAWNCFAVLERREKSGLARAYHMYEQANKEHEKAVRVAQELTEEQVTRLHKGCYFR